MNVLISPIKAVLDMVDDLSAAFIFCTSYGREALPKRENVLVLEFMDTEESNGYGAFTSSQAEAAATFVGRCVEDKEVLFVCCDSGESRSPAMAAAILRAQGVSDAYIWSDPAYHPNFLVYRLQCEAFGIEVGGAEFMHLREWSKATLWKKRP